MTYHHATTETQALAIVATAKAEGRRAYYLRLRAGCYEIRVW